MGSTARSDVGERVHQVLVVDDDPQVRHFLARVFSGAGYLVALAGDGHQALAVLGRAEPDLLVIDLVMPGKEGIETIMEVTRLHPGVKIIAISGGGALAPANYLKSAALLGADRTMAKPLRAEVMLSAARDLLRQEEREGPPESGASGKGCPARQPGGN